VDDVRDTTGAGDAFNAAFLSVWLEPTEEWGAREGGGEGEARIEAEGGGGCGSGVGEGKTEDAKEGEEGLEAAGGLVARAMRLGCGAGTLAVTRVGACDVPVSRSGIQAVLGRGGAAARGSRGGESGAVRSGAERSGAERSEQRTG
jgi:sugar/nucleoside kinase (ribokinase family)